MSYLRELLIRRYESLLASCFCLEEAGESFIPLNLPNELVLQAYFHVGLLGNEGVSTEGAQIRILEFGEWNRGAGPDFLRACVEIDGVLHRGDIELDSCPEDWERHGHGANVHFDHVILHVCVKPSSKEWFTRNSQHCQIPLLLLSPERLKGVLKQPVPSAAPCLGACHSPFEEMSSERIDEVLLSAAAYRQQSKCQLFNRKREALGADQAWFESFAEVLGYRLNKDAMTQLARRAPLSTLAGHAESILLGVAGFLVPVLPVLCEEGTRQYHRHIWDAWWGQREEKELAVERQLVWQFSSIRPANHPHRRVAVLAMIAQSWENIRPLLTYAHQKQLMEFLMSLRHDYWSHHVSLPSLTLKKPLALLGKERIQDFFINYVLPQEVGANVWEGYLHLRAKMPSHKVMFAANALLGGRKDVQDYLRYTYQHQAFIQIFDDFCMRNSCQECLFPQQLLMQ